MNNPLKILFKLPSRGRPERFFKALNSIINNLHDKENYLISCTLDEDDLAMCNAEVVDKIHAIPNVEIGWGLSDSKIHAINRSMPEYDWDIVVIGSDDIYFNLFGFDKIIRMEMENNFPDGDGYLHFREKDTFDILNVMTVIDKKYYDRFGYIYHPTYKSLWCDNEQTEVAKRLKRYAFIPYEIMLHRNSAYGYTDCPRDEMFDRQQKDWQSDEANFMSRKEKNFDL